MKTLILISLFFVQFLFAQTETKSSSSNSNASKEESSTDEVLKSFDYPELQVVPRASERLQSEAEVESNDRIYDYWPTIVPSALTLINGAQLMGSKRADLSPKEKDEADWSARTGILIGAGGLALSYHYYNRTESQKALAENKKIQIPGKRGQLYRERLAEEFLAEQASFDRKLIWMGAFLNLASNAWMADFSTDDNKAFAAVGALSSFLPLIFKQRSIKNFENHKRAKSRIYIPLSGVLMVPSSEGVVAVNSLNWSWTF